MSFAFERAGARAADARQQQLVDIIADDEKERRGQDRGGIGAIDPAEDHLQAERAEQVERSVHAEHHEIALREIDDAHDAEYQREADAHQPVDHADQQPGDEGLKDILDHGGGHRKRIPLSFRKPAGDEV